ncbi:hypothetical protein [Metallosphaera sp.]|uniref:hypothetical protein n=1 Tax=Metallosphaera sp. TaxID=2020860 RepID=UPI003173A404
MSKVYRQGDILLKEVENPSEVVGKIGEINKVSDKLIMGGETGKKHILEVPVYRVDGAMVVVLEKTEKMIHEEHRAMEIPQGVYTVGRVRDYLRDGFD